MLLSFLLCNFLVRMLKYLKNKYKNGFLPTKSWKNHLKKLHTYGSWEVFFSAAPTAQNSPELHFHFTNSFIQPSRIESLFPTHPPCQQTSAFTKPPYPTFLLWFLLWNVKFHNCSASSLGKRKNMCTQQCL